MCGIVGYTGTKPAKTELFDNLKKLEYRGYDSAGIALQTDGGLQVVRRLGKVGNLVAAAADADATSTCGIAHTRWATHGRPSEANAHPQRSCDNTVAVVHNGIIENYGELRERLTAEGHTFRSETDTEVVAHPIEDAYDGDLAWLAPRHPPAGGRVGAAGDLCTGAGRGRGHPPRTTRSSSPMAMTAAMRQATSSRWRMPTAMWPCWKTTSSPA